MVGFSAGSPGTLPTNWFATSTGGVVTRTIVGGGTETGVDYIDIRFQFSAAGSAAIQYEGGNVISCTPGQIWSTSVFLKLVSGSLSNITLSVGITEDDSSGNFLIGSNGNVTPTNGTLSSQRYSHIRTISNVAAAYTYGTISFSVFGIADITLRIGLPQMEQHNYVSSVIKTSTTTVTRAADLTTNGLLYSNIAEPDATWPAWNSGTAYVVGNKVSYLHRQYNCVVNNTNRNPLTDTTTPPAWTDAGPTNRYAMFDQVIGTSTTNTSSLIQVVIKGNNLNGLSLMQMNADKVQISMTVDGVLQYSRTLDLTSGTVLDWYQYFYSPIVRTTDYVLTDLPNITGAVITVTITTGSGTVSIGNLVNGLLYTVNNTGAGNATATSPTVGIIDYSIKTVDSFGNTKIVPRGYAKRMNVKLMLDSVDVDELVTLLTSIRTTPCVWIAADNTYKSMIVYGYYKDWEVEIAYTLKSYCSLNIEGLI